jgi:GTP-binding protein HflX
VRDISHSETEAQSRDVMDILTSLGVDENRPMIEVWNKSDLLDPEAREAVETRAGRDETRFAISAITGEGLETLLAAIAETLVGAKSLEMLKLPFSDGKKRAWLFAQEIVEQEDQNETGFDITVRWTARQKADFERV